MHKYQIDGGEFGDVGWDWLANRWWLVGDVGECKLRKRCECEIVSEVLRLWLKVSES